MTCAQVRCKNKSRRRRVRTGCTTCKSRRVKCDEEKPSCKRCSERNIECGGYELRVIEGRQRHRGDLPSSRSTQRRLRRDCPPLPTSKKASPEDDRPCITCNKSNDSNNMMLCDGCNDPYHTTCAGLEEVPHQKWVCMPCDKSFITELESLMREAFSEDRTKYHELQMLSLSSSGQLAVRLLEHLLKLGKEGGYKPKSFDTELHLLLRKTFKKDWPEDEGDDLLVVQRLNDGQLAAGLVLGYLRELAEEGRGRTHGLPAAPMEQAIANGQPNQAQTRDRYPQITPCWESLGWNDTVRTLPSPVHSNLPINESLPIADFSNANGCPSLRQLLPYEASFNLALPDVFEAPMFQGNLTRHERPKFQSPFQSFTGAVTNHSSVPAGSDRESLDGNNPPSSAHVTGIYFEQNSGGVEGIEQARVDGMEYEFAQIGAIEESWPCTNPFGHELNTSSNLDPIDQEQHLTLVSEGKLDFQITTVGSRTTAPEEAGTGHGQKAPLPLPSSEMVTNITSKHDYSRNNFAATINVKRKACEACRARKIGCHDIVNGICFKCRHFKVRCLLPSNHHDHRLTRQASADHLQQQYRTRKEARTDSSSHIIRQNQGSWFESKYEKPGGAPGYSGRFCDEAGDEAEQTFIKRGPMQDSTAMEVPVSWLPNDVFCEQAGRMECYPEPHNLRQPSNLDWFIPLPTSNLEERESALPNELLPDSLYREYLYFQNSSGVTGGMLKENSPCDNSAPIAGALVRRCMFMESGDGNAIEKVDAGQLTFIDNQNENSMSQENSRKRKLSTGSTDLMTTPLKRSSSQNLTAREEYSTYSYAQSQAIQIFSPYLQPTENYNNLGPQYSPPAGGYQEQQARNLGYCSTAATASPPTIKAQLSQTGTWGSYPNASMAHSPAVQSSLGHQRPGLPTPASTANSPLIRTPTLQRSSPSPASTLHGGHPGPFDAFAPYHQKAKLEITGELEEMAAHWSDEEWESKRRLVQFERSQSGSTVTTTFRAIHPEDLLPSSVCISCIYWEEKRECFVTGFDTMCLLEQLVGTRFEPEEKSRIRSNLEAFKPLLVSKGKSEKFLNVILAFSKPIPRHAKRDVKVFHWKDLASALKNIIGRFPASTLPPEQPTPAAGRTSTHEHNPTASVGVTHQTTT